MSRSPKLVLAACCLTMLAVGENSTAIMAALPAMTAELELRPATVEWIVNAYLLASAVFIVLGGEAADRFGAARSSAVGIALFALASLVIALAPDGGTVVAARALQGIGAAFAVPGTLAALTHEHAEADHPRVIGAWTGFLMLGFSIGPLIGGVLTHYAGWRATFWLNLLLMAPAGLALWLRPPAAAARTDRVDWLGLALLAVFMIALVQGLHGVAHLETAPAVVIIPLVLAVVALVGLVRVETRRSAPLVDLGLFRDRNFALACVLAFLLMADIMAILLYYNIFAQAAERARARLDAGGGGAFADAALGGLVRLRADVASAGGEDRHQADDGRRLAPPRARLRHRLARARRSGFRRADDRPVRGRRRHRVAVFVVTADRPCGAAADARRKGLGHSQLFELSRRHRRRDGRRRPVRRLRLQGRAGARRDLGARRRRPCAPPAERTLTAVTALWPTLGAMP